MEIAVSIMGISVTMLAGAVTYLAWRNGKVTRENIEKILKSSAENTDKILKLSAENSERILKDIKVIALLIIADSVEKKRELIDKISEI